LPWYSHGMASYPPSGPEQSWRVAIRFLTIGAVLAAMLAGLWWINRLADHLERQRALLLEIQRDVLVNQSQVGAVLAATDQNNHRLGTVEDRVGNAADDRRQLRDTDRQLLEAVIRLRAAIDHLEGPPPRDRVP
jgi:hypothetical protein